MHTVDTIKTGPFTARVVVDEDPTSPTEWDNLGKIAYTSDRYSLGTEHVSKARMDEIAAGIRSGKYIGLPVFAYVHSGMTIRAAESNPFHCPWDSGQSGFVYCTREDALTKWDSKPHKRMSAKLKASVLKCLKGEVETYDQYLTGDVYGVVIEDEDGNEVDSCWGFYGLEYAKGEAKRMAEAQAKQQFDAKQLPLDLHA